MTDFAMARLNMVEGQIRPNRVIDPRLIDAMGTIPREMFVSGPTRAIAYIDEDIAIAPGRVLMEPMILGRLLQEARIGHNDIALVIGAGTGYSTAVLSRMADLVVAIEANQQLAQRAVANLAALSLEKAVVYEAPLADGYPQQAPYDVILIDGAVAEVPQAIFDQLGEGGRLVTVVSEGKPFGQGRLFERRGGIVSGRTLFDASTALLPGFTKVPGFRF